MVDLVYYFVDWWPVDRDRLDGIVDEYNIDIEKTPFNNWNNWEFNDIVELVFEKIIDKVVDEHEEEIAEYCDLGELKDYLEESIYHNYSDSHIDVTSENLEKEFSLPKELAEKIINELP